MIRSKTEKKERKKERKKSVRPAITSFTQLEHPDLSRVNMQHMCLWVYMWVLVENHSKSFVIVKSSKLSKDEAVYFLD